MEGCGCEVCLFEKELVHFIVPFESANSFRYRFHSDFREMSSIQNISSGILPNQYLSHQSLPQLPQQYPYQQVGGWTWVFEWAVGDAEWSSGVEFETGPVLAGRFQGAGGGKECERSTPRTPDGSHQEDYENGRLGATVCRVIGLVPN